MDGDDSDDYCPTGSGKRKRPSGRDRQAEEMPVTKKRSNRTPVHPLLCCLLADVPTAPRTASLHSKMAIPHTAEPFDVVDCESEAEAPPMIPSPGMTSSNPRTPRHRLMLISSWRTPLYSCLQNDRPLGYLLRTRVGIGVR